MNLVFLGFQCEKKITLIFTTKYKYFSTKIIHRLEFGQ